MLELPVLEYLGYRGILEYNSRDNERIFHDSVSSLMEFSAQIIL